MVIENRDLAVGTKLVAKYKGEQWHVEVLPGEPRTYGFVGKRPKDAAQVYKSPSSAGSAVMGGTACNGWRFWTIDGEPPATEPRNKTHGRNKAQAKAATPKRTEARKTAKVFYRSANQKGLEEGQTRYYCNACAPGFIADHAAFAGMPVDACPEGHRNDDPELTTPAATDEAK